MDKLDITGLSILTTIGVYAWEKKIKQKVVIDISIPINASTCQDELTNTVDYEKLSQRITSHVESNQFALIETIADDVALIIKKEFAVSNITVKVAKPQAIKNAGNVSITVER